VRFGRKRPTDQDPGEDAGESNEGLEDLPPVGPLDESQVDLEEHEGLDLGSLVVTPGEDMEVQLQLDETSGEVGAVVLVGHEGALELRAFAASRGADAWEELRPQIAAEVTRMGGTATQAEGAFGAELRCLVPMQTPDGQGGTQVSRVTGHQGGGGAWLLRATLVGLPATEDELAGPWDEVIRRLVVRRGRDARPPGSPLPLRLPPDARQLDAGD
jgi:hypothetical protein